MKLRRNNLIVAGMIALLLLAGVLDMKGILGGGPAEGNITKPTAKLSGITQVAVDPVVVNAPDASFEYPKALQLYSQTTAEQPVLESYVFRYPDIEPWQLSITVNQLNSAGGLMADNSYQFRTTQPSRYKQTTETINGQSFAIMQDTQAGGFSEVAYTVNGEKSADISLYGDDGTGRSQLAATLAMVLSSWQWKN